MKIVLTRRNHGGFSQSTESYMRVVFAHITHHIKINQVDSKNINKREDQIIVHYQTQPGTADVNFREEITKAVSLRGDLTLHSLELPRKILEKIGLKVENTNAKRVTIQSVSHEPGIPNAYTKFARILQNDSNLKQDILNPNFVSLRLTVNADGTSEIELSKSAPAKRPGQNVSTL